VSTQGTLDRIARHLVVAVRPLEEAFSHADAFRVLLLQLGWDAPGLPASYQVVADKVVQATSALEALADGASVDEVLAVIDKAGAVYRAIDALTEAPDGIDPAAFLPELARRLFEYLLGRQLLAEAPGCYATLEALGIIALEDHPPASNRPGFARIRFDWDQIPAILSDPALIPARVYGWGTPDLNFPKIADLVIEVIIGLGLPASLDYVSDELAAALQAQATGPPEKAARVGMTLVLCDVPVPGGTRELVGLLVTELPAEGTALPGMVLLPQVPDGIADRVELGGWVFTLRAGTDLATQLGVVVRPDGVSVRYPGAPGQSLPSAGFGIALAHATDAPLVLFGQTGKTRLELASAELSGAIDVEVGDLELKAGAAVEDLALVIELDDLDSFLGSVLGDEPLRIKLGVALGWSSRTGLDFMAGGGFEVTVYPHLDAGVVRFDRVDLAVRFAAGTVAPALQVLAATSFSGELGPVAFSVDRLGVQLPVTFADGNAGPFDVRLEPLLPTGLGLAIDASVVVGGGFLRFDPQKEEYSGMLELQIAEKLAVKATGLLITRMPDGAKGYSLLALITAEDFKPIPLPLGFKLTGIGGLLAINRTFDEEVLRAGIKNRTLDSVMFPQDPIRNAPQILSNLNRVFPPANGHHLFGPMAQIAWGTPPLITADLAVVLEFGARLRLLILAQVAAILPKRENDLVRLQMDAVGVLDFDQGTAALDATLYDSRLLKKFVLTGDVAMRLKWEASQNFALAVGGLHPAFDPPPNFPKLERIALNLSAGDNPRLRCEAYFALTSNTVQFGARAELYAEAAGFSIQGETGFDVLIQRDPFHFLADFYAQVQLKRKTTNLFKVRVEGALAGPRPLHLKGKATFEILWMDVSIRIDKTLVEGELPPRPEPVDVLAQLKEALGNPGNWTGRLPDGQRPMVSLRAKPGAPTDVLLHPLGTLTVKQGVVPLNLDISRFGHTTPAGARRFTISSVGPGGENQTTESVEDFFAPAQFFEMSDDEKLSVPSFQSMAAGVSIGSDEFDFTDTPDDWLEVEAIEFDTITVDNEQDEPRRSGPDDLYKLSPELLGKQALFGAAGTSDLRRTGKAKYRTTRVGHKLVREGWSIVATDDLTVQPAPGIEAGKPASYSEAAQALRKMEQEDPTKAGGFKILRLSEVRESIG
jgi:hypothetical protein